MEGLFGILVGVAVVFSTIFNAFKKLSETSTEKFSPEHEIDNKINRMFESQEFEAEKIEGKDAVEEMDGIGGEVKEKIIDKVKNKKSSKANDKKDGSTGKKISPKNSTRKKTIKNDKFTEEEIIQGVIMKEILDSPRARRPYLPPHLRK